MNFQLMAAEMEVRKTMWGDEIDGLDTKNDEGIDTIIVQKVIERLRDQDTVAIEGTKRHIERIK